MKKNILKKITICAVAWFLELSFASPAQATITFQENTYLTHEETSQYTLKFIRSVSQEVDGNIRVGDPSVLFADNNFSDIARDDLIEKLQDVIDQDLEDELDGLTDDVFNLDETLDFLNALMAQIDEIEASGVVGMTCRGNLCWADSGDFATDLASAAGEELANEDSSDVRVSIGKAILNFFQRLGKKKKNKKDSIIMANDDWWYLLSGTINQETLDAALLGEEALGEYALDHFIEGMLQFGGGYGPAVAVDQLFNPTL